jgi:rSAM/selenodomain-associated transferase 2
MKFSIVIPVLHEARRIQGLIEHLDHLEVAQSLEIIVVDGSPELDTIRAIRSDRVRALSAKTGRAAQMNAGAAAATGDVLVFLHADTKLPADALTLMTRCLGTTDCVGGAFELAIKSSRLRFKLLARWTTLRCRITRIPYGDQAIFLRRHYFHSIGGYADTPIMEDVELMRRIKRRGDRICILPQRALTSARRWEKEGFVYVNLRNTLLLIVYFLGVSPEKLAVCYRTHEGKREDR